MSQNTPPLCPKLVYHFKSGRKSPTRSYEKQAGWVENGRAGENPQPEATEKQAGWVENGGTGEIPQPEATRSSAR